MAYCTLAQIRQHLGLGDTENSDDALLTSIITRAQAFIDAHCHRTFEASSDTTRTLDAINDVDGPMLWLGEDLCAITSVINGDADVLTTSEYVTEPRNTTPYYAITIRSDSNLAWTYSTYYENAISIVGRWAYSTTAPADIVQACIMLATWLYRQKDTTADIDRPLIGPGGAIVMPQTMPGHVQAMLRPYVRRL